jgi:putative proteasome-type protease
MIRSGSSPQARTVAHRATFEAEAPELAAMIDTWSSVQREALHRLPNFIGEQNQARV